MAKKTGKGAQFLAQGIRFTEEFTTMQLIIGVSVLMLFGLICFLSGIVVGRIDTSLQAENEIAAEANPKVETAKDAQSSPIAAKPATKAPPKSEVKKPETPKPLPKPTPTTSSGPRVTDLPPLPPNTAPSPPKPESTPLPTPPSAPVPAPEPEAKPSAPMLEAITPPATLPGEPTPETAAPQAPLPVEAAPRGAFGIQVASFSGEKRNDDAAKFQRDMKQKSGLDSEIVAGSDGFTRVLVVGYATRSDADKALPTVKQKANLKDAFVREL